MLWLFGCAPVPLDAEASGDGETDAEALGDGGTYCIELCVYAYATFVYLHVLVTGRLGSRACMVHVWCECVHRCCDVWCCHRGRSGFQSGRTRCRKILLPQSSINIRTRARMMCSCLSLRFKEKTRRIRSSRLWKYAYECGLLTLGPRFIVFAFEGHKLVKAKK